MRCGKCGKNQRGPADSGVCKCHDLQTREVDRRAFGEGGIERKGSKKIHRLEVERAKFATTIQDAAGRPQDGAAGSRDGDHSSPLSTGSGRVATDENVSIGTGSDTSGG